MEALTRIWLAIPSILTILGLSSLVDGIVTWYSFLGDIVSVYQQARDWLALLVFNWWLAYFEWRLPDWAADLWIVWTASFLIIRIAARIPVEWESRYWIPFQWSGLRGAFTGYALSPLLLIYACFMPKSDPLETPPDEQYPWFVVEAIRSRYRSIALALAGGFIVLLFINWQVLQRLSG